jgi:hypothetical protein
VVLKGQENPRKSFSSDVLAPVCTQAFWKGLCLRGPQAVFDRASVVGLRQIGRSWRQIAAALSVGVATVRLYSGGVPKPSAKGLGAATQSNALRARDRLCRNDVVLTHWQRPTWRTGVIESLYVSPPRHGFALDAGHASAGATR